MLLFLANKERERERERERFYGFYHDDDDDDRDDGRWWKGLKIRCIDQFPTLTFTQIDDKSFSLLPNDLTSQLISFNSI